MNSQLKISNLEDQFAALVDSIRESGTIDSAVILNGVVTIQSANNLNEGDVITINTTDYKVFNVSATQFDVKSQSLLSGAWTSKAPYFMDGHLLEISNRLAQKDQSTGILKWQKYPLVVLIQDFDYDENRISRANVSLNIVIVNETKEDYNTQERRDNNFTPILDPIYNNLMNAIDKSIVFSFTDDGWTTTRRYYWGSSLTDANPFNDKLDAIEINNLNLSIPKNC